jgi:hypothetical protein
VKSDEDQYSLDDLISYERRQMLFVAGLMVFVAIYFALGGKAPFKPQASPGASVAPSSSGANK